jgi:hypothetical protein
MSRIPALLVAPLLAGFAHAADAQERAEQTVLRTEQELNISIETPALAQCQATTTAGYEQRNTLARVRSTIAVQNCAAASGELTVTLRIRDANGEIKTVDFRETWQRADDKDVAFSADYPIGENVELVSARVRGLRCTCADPAPEAKTP